MTNACSNLGCQIETVWQVFSNSVVMTCKLFVQQLAKHFHHHDGFLGVQTKVLGHNKFCTVLTKNVA